MTSSEIDRSQIRYARLAGFLFLWLIMTGLGGLFLNAHIVGSGAFDETAKRVAASEHLYRVALCLELIETMSAALLAQLAMYWRLGESFLGAAGMMGGFVRLGLYISPKSIAALGAEQSQALV